MSDFDLVIRNGTVATAADTTACDIGIKDGPNAIIDANKTFVDTVLRALSD